eukprot:GHVS01055381.1.p1 GENE.GHVS01055381.1~~GHVS01055381.1.p1  ORF type:complete len:202 (-),score=31.08 GHVS01055381.1:526-1131(-)
MFHVEEEIWGKVTEAIRPGYAVAEVQQGISKRSALDMRDVMPLLKEAVEKHSILPAFAVARIQAANTNKFCIVKPFFESWTKLTDMADNSVVAHLHEVVARVTPMDMAAEIITSWLRGIDGRITSVQDSQFVVRPAAAAAEAAGAEISRPVAAVGQRISFTDAKELLVGSRLVLVNFQVSKNMSRQKPLPPPHVPAEKKKP